MIFRRTRLGGRRPGQCATGQVDKKLAAMITPAELAGLRAGLVALAGIRERTGRDGQPKDL
jgi:hypothetical protein